MTLNNLSFDDPSAADFGEWGDELPKSMLVIGDLDDWHRNGRGLPNIEGVVFARLKDFDTALVRRVRPDVIVSPLMSFMLDAVDIAGTLAHSQYRGRYMIVTGQVKCHELIRREIARAAPDLDFHLLPGDRLKYLH